MFLIVLLKHASLHRGGEAAKEFVKSGRCFVEQRFICCDLEGRGLDISILCCRVFEVVLICRVGSFVNFSGYLGGMWAENALNLLCSD